MNGVATELAVTTSAVRDKPLDTARDWRHLTLIVGACVSLVEGILLQRKHGLFTGGFLAGYQLNTWADGGAFLMVAFLLNVTAAAPLCAAGLIGGRALGLRPWALRFATVAIGLLPLLAGDFLTYQIWSYLGDAFDFDLMFTLTGRRVSELFAVTAPLVTTPLSLGLLLLGGVAATTTVLHRIQGKDGAEAVIPSAIAVGRGVLIMMALSAAVVLGIALSSHQMAFGLRWTPAGLMTIRLLNVLTDFDKDGHGLVRTPLDNAPFDPAIHPYALEIPGNGIDENGLAGDLPVVRASYQESPPPRGEWQSRPPVILFVLESFRADAVGASYGGREVTPRLDALARQGAKVNAWSHNGFTAQSRFHILTGSLGGRQGTSLLDDFKDHGYEVAYFSAQDEAFGDLGVKYDRVDKYYDARQDSLNRYTEYSTPGSLAVPYDVLEGQIQAYLDERRSIDPVFLYVNFHDTHYPYNHSGLKNILGVEPLPAWLISPARRGELWGTYLNAAANVDAAIGRVIEAVKRSVGVAPAVVVISDHGESLFEGGFLGHGYALNVAQTRIPLVVAGLPMRIRMPFGQANLRDAIHEALTSRALPSGAPVVETAPGRRVFQYLGTVKTPTQIGWLTTEGQFTYDFRTNRVGLWNTTVNPRDLKGEPARTFIDLVHTWESMQLAQAKAAASAFPH